MGTFEAKNVIEDNQITKPSHCSCPEIRGKIQNTMTVAAEFSSISKPHQSNSNLIPIQLETLKISNSEAYQKRAPSTITFSSLKILPQQQITRQGTKP